jgi:ABC-type nickel/cobalt efflux system permease component RcnA
MKSPIQISSRFIIASLTAVLLLAMPLSAWAHPLGNFTINHYAGLHLTPTTLAVDYVLDMAEIPAFQEIARLDANKDGQPQPAEFEPYPPQACEAIRPALDVRVNGRLTALALTASGVEFPPGAGGLFTLRLTCAFSAPISTAAQDVQLSFSDNTYAERLGWREIVVTSADVSVAGDFATTSLSRRLTAYPDDLLSNPLDQRQVTLTLNPTAGAEAQSSARAGTTPAAAGSNRSDAFTQLITLEKLDFPTVAIALAIAMVWGAMHALTPGHGKTIVGAYLVGSRGTARHALYLGLTTTITHTAGVLALGLVTLFASRYVVPEQLYPWLSFLSGALIVGLGLNLLVSRLRSGASRHPGHHDHDHQHHDHSHLPPGADGAPVNWRSLLALGVSGGLLPCPSALVVMLSAIALDKIAFGLVLVMAFSLGLAGVLTGLGVMMVYAGRWFSRFPAESRAVRLLPAVSALFITVAGMGLTVQALAQLGWIRL